MGVISAGVPNGFVLGPLLQNIVCNDVFNFAVLEEVTHLEDEELYSCKVVGAFKLALVFVEEKTEAVLSLSAVNEITPGNKLGIMSLLPRPRSDT